MISFRLFSFNPGFSIAFELRNPIADRSEARDFKFHRTEINKGITQSNFRALKFAFD